jgi:DNA polymerase IV
MNTSRGITAEKSDLFNRTMPLALNHNPPTIMHVDLNSCFATIEQQANPLLRGKPIVVAAYNSPNGCVVAPSIEAKRYGIKTGMTVRDARLLYPPVVVRTPDPPKYRAVHLMFRKIFRDYSPDATPKSIDEAVIDLTDTLTLFKGGIVDIGKQIKKRFREEIGEWMVCSIGVGTNRFLAKLAASLHKPSPRHNFRDVFGLLSRPYPFTILGCGSGSFSAGLFLERWPG